MRTLQSQCGLCLPSHSILRMLFLGTFSTRVWYITLLSRDDPNLLETDPYWGADERFLEVRTAQRVGEGSPQR